MSSEKLKVKCYQKRKKLSFLKQTKRENRSFFLNGGNSILISYIYIINVFINV